MRLHPQAIEKLLNMVQNLAGHKEDTKLRKAFSDLDFTPYTKQTTGETILVETQELLKQQEQILRNNK